MGDSREFVAFVDAFFSAAFRWDPSWATHTGLHEYDRDLPDRSAEAHRNRIDEVRALAERARKLRREDLDPSERIDLELILGRLRADALTLETLETWRHNPIDYLWLAGSGLDSLIKRDFAPPGVRLEALISRLRQFPRVVANMKSNVTDPPREFTELALRLARGSAAFLGAGIEAWAAGAADGNSGLMADFRPAHQRAIALPIPRPAPVTTATWPLKTGIKTRRSRPGPER